VRLKISSKATRQLRKIKNNQDLTDRLYKAFSHISENPYEGKLLSGVFEEIYSWRVGDWRILYRIYKNQLLILIVNVADRKEVYK